MSRVGQQQVQRASSKLHTRLFAQSHGRMEHGAGRKSPQPLCNCIANFWRPPSSGEIMLELPQGSR
eukprot:16436648-Heterocapsa_arctica.AAC.1